MAQNRTSWYMNGYLLPSKQKRVECRQCGQPRRRRERIRGTAAGPYAGGLSTSSSFFPVTSLAVLTKDQSFASTVLLK